MKNIKISGIILLCCLTFGVYSAAFAGGFQIYQAAAADAMALGAATVARDDLISAAWYNPAAVMEFKKSEYSSGYSLAKLNWHYEPGNGIRKIKVKDEVQIVPGSHLVYPLRHNLTAAFSLYTPFGLAMNWHDEDIRRMADTGLFADANSPAGTVVTKALPAQAQLQVPYFNSTLATRVSEKLSLAGGISVIKADFKMRFLSQAMALPATPLWNNFVKYQADGWGLGYILSGHYKCNERLKFGLRYLSNADVKLKGTVEDHPQVKIARVKGTLKLPSTLTFGAAMHLNDRWVVSCDLMRTEWSRYDKLEIEPRDAGATLGGFSAQKDWHNSYSYRFGAEFRHSERWTFRGGYVYDESPASDATRNFELPATNGHIFSLGAARKGQNHSIDIGYSYMILKNGRAGTTSLNGAGEFTNADNHFLMISYNRAL